MTSVSMIPDCIRVLLTCPITQSMMVDPVQVDCEPGHAFDRQAIEQWLQGNKTCPVCRAKVTKVVVERNLKGMLEVYAPPKLLQPNVQVLSFEDLKKYAFDIARTAEADCGEDNKPIKAINHLKYHVSELSVDYLQRLAKVLADEHKTSDFMLGLAVVKTDLDSEVFTRLKSVGNLRVSSDPYPQNPDTSLKPKPQADASLKPPSPNLSSVNAEEQNRLGDAYAKGIGVKLDLKQAYKYYCKAAEMDHAGAQYNVANCYYEAKGVQHDFQKALKWYQKAADQGDVKAQNSLAFCFEGGEGVWDAFRQKATWLQKLLDERCNLALKKDDWKGQPLDMRKAITWYLKAAEIGYAIAQMNLGRCYDYGQGVPQDHKQAVSWYQKAANQGYALAQNNLGFCYEKGRGVPQDHKQAVSWYQNAADQGYTGAQFNLGLCYANGQGVPQNHNLAVSWYQKAADQGNAMAQSNLGFCYEKGQGVPQDQKQAVSWYQKAADQGNADAQTNLGNCYKNGRGVPKDDKLADYWHRKASEKDKK